MGPRYIKKKLISVIVFTKKLLGTDTMKIPLRTEIKFE
jgi:hypothetical protein